MPAEQKPKTDCPICVECGERPWGFGLDGTLCAPCAARRSI